MIPVAILCGGYGTRLKPVTEKVPKSLAPVNGVPFIDHQLALLRKKCIKNVVLCVGHFGEQIEDYVKDGSKYKLDIVYSYDGDKPLGTGGAIKKALPLLPDNFLVIYGDSYLTTSYYQIYRNFLSTNKPCLMTYYLGVEYGLTVFSKRVFKDCPDRFDLWDLFSYLQRKGLVNHHIVEEPFYEVGSFEGIKKLEEYLCNIQKNSWPLQ